MRSNGIRVDTEKRDRNECTISPQFQDSVAEFQRFLVFGSIPLMEINVCIVITNISSVQHGSRYASLTEMPFTAQRESRESVSCQSTHRLTRKYRISSRMTASTSETGLCSESCISLQDSSQDRSDPQLHSLRMRQQSGSHASHRSALHVAASSRIAP